MLVQITSCLTQCHPIEWAWCYYIISVWSQYYPRCSYNFPRWFALIIGSHQNISAIFPRGEDLTTFFDASASWFFKIGRSCCWSPHISVWQIFFWRWLSGWWFQPLWNIWKSVEIIIPNIWTVIKYVPNHQPDYVPYFFENSKKGKDETNHPRNPSLGILPNLIPKLMVFRVV
jgi:hypothetical protein